MKRMNFRINKWLTIQTNDFIMLNCELNNYYLETDLKVLPTSLNHPARKVLSRGLGGKQWICRGC